MKDYRLSEVKEKCIKAGGQCGQCEIGFDDCSKFFGEYNVPGKWKLETDTPPTQKQLEYILALRENSHYPLPEFTGTTKREASEWISKNINLAYENPSPEANQEVIEG